MKTAIITFMALMMPVALFGQVPHKITYDFSAKTWSDGGETKLKEGDEVTVIVKNINTFLYKVNVDITKKAVLVNPPKILTDLWPDISQIVNFQPLKGKSNFAEQVDSTSTPESQDFLDAYAALADYAQSYQKLLVLLNQPKLDIEKIKTITDLQAQLSELNIIDLIRNLEEAFSKIDTPSDKEKAIYSLVQESDYKKHAILIETLVQNLDYTYFEYVIPVIKANKEKINISIDVQPRNLNPSGLPLNGYTIKRSWSIIKKMKTSFHSGGFATNLKSKTYTVQPTFGDSGAVTGQTIIEDGSAPTALGLYGAVDWTWHIDGPYRAGLTLGAGVDQAADPRLLGGVSFSIGHANRIVFSYGYLLGTYKVASDRWDLGNTYPGPDKYVIESVDRKTLIGGSQFFSIGLSFGK